MLFIQLLSTGFESIKFYTEKVSWNSNVMSPGQFTVEQGLKLTMTNRVDVALLSRMAVILLRMNILPNT